MIKHWIDYMKHKNKILVILIALTVIFVMAQALGSVSAATGEIVDKGVAPHKNDKSVKVNWTATVYKDKKLEINKYFSKNNAIYKTEKTTFKRISNTKLKVFTAVKQNKTTTKTNKYVKIKKSKSIKSYYFNIYQPKIHKNIVTSKSFDSGGGYLSNLAHGSIKWNAKIYYNNKKVFIKENVSAILGYVKNTVIERISKGKLKITTKSTGHEKVWDSKAKEYVFSNGTKTTYVKSKLSPKNYYLKVYKPKMTKYLSDRESGCIEVIHIDPDTLIYRQIAKGNLVNSSGRMEWTINMYYGEKVEIVRNYTDNSFINSTTAIEWFNKTTLKISIIYSNGNSSPQINYVNYSLSPYEYFSNVYKPEMLKLIVGNATIVETKNYPIPYY